MTFVIEWESTNPQETIAFFLQGIKLPQGVSLTNYHVVGEPRGYAIAEAQTSEAVHELITGLPASLNTRVSQVINDDAAKRTLAGKGKR